MRKILDYKVVSTVEALTLAKFVHDLTLKGYEPLPLQCSRQFGNIVITMALYEKEKGEDYVEKADESTVVGLGSKTSSDVGGVDTSGEVVESEIKKTDSGESNEDSTGESVGTGVISNSTTATKRKSTAKPKVAKAV